ncbi:MAG: hypothetical protein ACR2JM_16030, partial [Mycobacterium sp.]
NLCLLVITAAIIFTTCRLLDVSTMVSFVVTLGWTLSLPSRSVIGVIRQYTLLSLMAALVLLVLVLWLKTNQTRYVIGLAVIFTAGFLTHYQFWIPALFGSLFAAAVQYRRGNRRQVIQLGVAFGVALACFWLIHPDFRQSFVISRQLAQPFTFPTFVQRIVAGAASIGQIFDPLDWSHPLPYGLLEWKNPLFIALNIANVGIGVAAAYLVIRMGLKAFRSRSADELLSVGGLPAFTGVAAWSVVMILYVMHVSPVHAIGLQYLHFTTPFIFVAVAQGIEKVKASIPDRAFAVAPVVMVLCAVLATTVFVAHKKERQRIDAVANADTLLIDTDKMGILPAVVWHARPTTKVYGAMQDKMLANFPALSPARDGRLFFVSSYAYGNTEENRDRELSLISRAGFGEPVKQPGGVVFLIHLGGDLYTFTD